MPLLDLKWLAVLRAVAEHGSFASAAEALSFTPSAVSQQMTALGREAGVALFDRSPRGMRLTDAGRALLAHADVVFAELADAETEIAAIANGNGGRLRFGSFPTGTVAFAAEAMGIFRERHPGVDLHFIDGEPYESVKRLNARELDVALVFDFDHWSAATDYDGRPVCEDAVIDYHHLFDDPFVAIIPRDHPLARRKRLALTDLVGERVLGSPELCSPWGTDFDVACRAAGVTPAFESRYRTVDFAAVQAIVATGRGISLVPALSLFNLHPGIVARTLEAAPVRHVAAATLGGANLSPACRAMLEVLGEVARPTQVPSGLLRAVGS